MKNCLNPWNYLSIEFYGDCYFCCSAFLSNKFSIGNILEEDINEVWNGAKAQEFRNDILTSNYSYCNLTACKNVYDKYNTNDIENKKLTAPYPEIVQFTYDTTCFSKCIFCRDENINLSDIEQENWNKIIDTKIIPLLCNAKIVVMNGGGELFNSKHSQKLLEKISKTYPKIKYEIFSNGAEFTKEKIEEYNLSDKIQTAHISINAASGKTYSKIFRTNNFSKVMNNLNYLVSLKNQKKIDNIILGFVINSINYKEMKKFMQIANKLNVSVSFTLTQKYRDTKYTSSNNFEIWKSSPDKFSKILKDPIFKSSNCYLDFTLDLKEKEKQKYNIIEKLFHLKKKN